jgi:hypothetical protein
VRILRFRAWRLHASGGIVRLRMVESTIFLELLLLFVVLVALASKANTNSKALNNLFNEEGHDISAEKDNGKGLQDTSKPEEGIMVANDRAKPGTSII